MHTLGAVLLPMLIFHCIYCSTDATAEQRKRSNSSDTEQLEHAMQSLFETILSMSAGGTQRFLYQEALVLNDTLTSSIKDRKFNDTISEITEALDHVSGALQKLSNGQPDQMLSGLREVLLAAESFHQGTFKIVSGYLGKILNGLMALFNALEFDNAVTSVMQRAVRGKYNETVRGKLFWVMNYMVSYGIMQDTLTKELASPKYAVKETDLRKLIPYSGFYRSLEPGEFMLRYIKETGVGSKEAERGMQVVHIYADVCVIKLFSLIKTAVIFVLSGKHGLTETLHAPYELIKSICKDALQFLRLHGPVSKNMYGLLGQFYPEDQNEKTMALSTILNILRISKVHEFGFSPLRRYIISPQQFDNYVICSQFKETLLYSTTPTVDDSVHGCLATNQWQLWTTLREIENGFFEIIVGFEIENVQGEKITGREKLCQVKSGGHYTMTHSGYHEKHCDTDATAFRLIPTSVSAEYFLIASKRLPTKFIYMGFDSQKQLKLSNGDPGPAGYWHRISL